MIRIISAVALAAVTLFWDAQSPAGEPAFFWFDSRKISDSGESFYGAYAYRRLLPGFSPARRGKDNFAYFDGDFLPQGRLDIPHQRGEEAVAQRARPLEGLAYVIAMFAYQTPTPFREVDAMLRAAGTTGYLGMTTQPPMTVNAFIEVTRAMSLPVAMKQEGAKLRIVSFAFLSDAELRRMGFEPERVSR